MDMESAEVAEDDGRRCKTKGDIICQRVELLTNRGGNMEQTGHHAVEEIKHSTYDNKE